MSYPAAWPGLFQFSSACSRYALTYPSLREHGGAAPSTPKNTLPTKPSRVLKRGRKTPGFSCFPQQRNARFRVHQDFDTRNSARSSSEHFPMSRVRLYLDSIFLGASNRRSRRALYPSDENKHGLVVKIGWPFQGVDLPSGKPSCLIRT